MMGDLGARYGRRGPARSDVAAAALLLGLTLPATAEEVRQAYVDRVRAAHPDSGGQGGDMQALKEARLLLMREVNRAVENVESRSCPMCLGRGRVITGFAAEPCNMCGGKGTILK